jgi:two-component system KDP operon response regulator KdpE
LTHRDILTKVWGQEYAEANDYLKVHIQHLRRKLGDDSENPRIIATERGIGYKLIARPAE